MRARFDRNVWSICAFLLCWAGATGCKKTKGSRPKRSLSWRQKVVRVIPADANGDGSAELIAIYRTPDGKRSLMEAFEIGTGKRLWEQRTVGCWEPDDLIPVRQEAVGRSHLLVAATIGGPEGEGGRTEVALHRLRDGKRLWTRQFPGEVNRSSLILRLHGQWALVSAFQTSSSRHMSKLHVIRASDGSQQCSVMLGALLRNPALIGSWLLLSEVDAIGPPSELVIVSLKDCTRRIAGTLAAGGGRNFSHDDQVFALLRTGNRLTDLSLRRFDPQTGRLIAVEPHPKLFSRGLTGANTSAHASGLLRAHDAGDGGNQHRIALYAWPPHQEVRWSLPIPKPTTWALVYDVTASSALRRPWSGASTAQLADASVRFLPIVLTHRGPDLRPAGRWRLSILDLQTGSITWTSRPLLSEEAPWGRTQFTEVSNGRAGSMYVLRFRPGGKKVPGLLWFVDGQTGKTLTVLDGSLPFWRWQILGDRLYSLLPGPSKQSGGAPYVFDLRREKILFGSVPTKRFASQRKRLEAELGPLP
ncbi:MAG: hypothetical protein ABI333_17765 [bacterium]